MEQQQVLQVTSWYVCIICVLIYYVLLRALKATDNNTCKCICMRASPILLSAWVCSLRHYFVVTDASRYVRVHRQHNRQVSKHKARQPPPSYGGVLPSGVDYTHIMSYTYIYDTWRQCAILYIPDNKDKITGITYFLVHSSQLTASQQLDAPARNSCRVAYTVKVKHTASTVVAVRILFTLHCDSTLIGPLYSIALRGKTFRKTMTVTASPTRSKHDDSAGCWSRVLTVT